jgi:ligand-binding sensor domain-containing protein
MIEKGLNNFIKMISYRIQFRKIIFAAVLVYLLLSGSSCEKDVSTTPPLDDPSEGFLFIESQPEGAAIFLNGKNSGKFTPDSLIFLDEGNYNLTLKKKFYKDTTLFFSLSLDERKFISIDYKGNPSMYGNVSLGSNPTNSSIFLGDSSINLNTPAFISGLLPGNYSFIFKFFNHISDTLQLIIESGKTTTAFAVLEDTSTWLKYNMANSSLSSNTLTAITVDNNNIKWIGTGDKGLIKFDEQSFTNYSTLNSPLPSNNILTIGVDPLNRKWIGTEGGLAVFDDISWTVYNISNSNLPSNRVESVVFENDLVWIGTSAGLVKINGNNWAVFNLSNSNIPWVWVNDIAVDLQGNKWLGLNHTAISKFNDTTFTAYTSSNNNFSSNIVSSIAVEGNGNIWFGHYPESEQTGLSIYNGNLFSSILLGTISNRIEDILIDGNVKWIAMKEGLVKIQGTTPVNTYRQSNSKLTFDHISSIAKDHNGFLWIATFGGGLNKFKY